MKWCIEGRDKKMTKRKDTLCMGCGEIFKGKGSHFYRGCSGKKRFTSYITCRKCSETFSISNIKRHESVCERQRKSTRKSDKEIKGKCFKRKEITLMGRKIYLKTKKGTFKHKKYCSYYNEEDYETEFCYCTTKGSHKLKKEKEWLKKEEEVNSKIMSIVERLGLNDVTKDQSNKM
jgi:hypothetical protein